MSSNELRRRDFMGAGLAATAAALLPGCKPRTTGAATEVAPEFRPGEPLPWTNWAGNQSCRPAARWAPKSEDELVAQLAQQPGSVRPVGAGHSFTALVPSDGTLVATDFLSGVLSTDDDAGTAEVWAGTRLHQLGPLLHARGHALSNLPDIDYQTIAGATATSTHGTGVEFGSLSSFIEGLTLATASGELLECDREHNAEIFHAARCSLGALGVITRLKLRTQPAFQLVERIRFAMLADVLADAERMAAENRHFELFSFPHSSVAMVMETNEGSAEVAPVGEDDAEGMNLLRDVYRWVSGIPLVGNALYDLAVQSATDGAEAVRSGPSFSVLTHDRVMRFREMEYTVPAEAGPACLREIMATIDDLDIPVVFPIEYRYVQADDVWLSMFHDRPGCTISIHQFANEDHRPYFAAIEPIFWKYDGRPHWGKVHGLAEPELARLYPRWRDFTAVRRELDPGGKLLNAHLREVLGA